MNRSSYEIVCSPLHDRTELDALLAPLVGALRRVGARERPATPSTPHLVVVATGGTEQAILDAAESVSARSPGCPIVLVAHPRHNSLPAALEALARWRQLGRNGRIVFAADRSDDADDGRHTSADIDVDIGEAVSDLTAWHRFHDTRLGLVGTPSDWLVASTPDAGVVRSRWGPELVDVTVASTVEAFEAVPVEVGRHVADHVGTTPAHDLPAPHDVARAGRLDPALRDMIDRHRLDAVTVRCFDFLGSIETSGCLALARLNDDGIVAGCEGDVPAALAMLWARYLLDQPAWIANPAAIDTTENRVVVAHCTIAPSMIDAVELSTHFESGIGVGIHGRLRAEEVTLVRIGGVQLDRCWIAEGSVEASGDDAALCRTQATIRLTDRRVEELLVDPLGNHLVVIEGRHRRRLERWQDWALGPAR